MCVFPTRRIAADGLLIVFAVIPLLYVAHAGRGNDTPAPCPGEIAASDACPDGATKAACGTYPGDKLSCNGHEFAEKYVNTFKCVPDGTGNNYCYQVVVPDTDPAVAMTAPCSKTYYCVSDEAIATPKCVQGPQKGDTITSPIKKSQPCVKSVDLDP